MKASLQPPVPTEEDDLLVKMYLLHVVLLDVLEQDIRSLNAHPLKMSGVYIRGLSTIQDKVIAQLTLIRKDMRTQGIRIFDETRNSKGIQASYLCRGYQRRIFMLWTYVKAETGSELCRYLGINLT